MCYAPSCDIEGYRISAADYKLCEIPCYLEYWKENGLYCDAAESSYWRGSGVLSSCSDTRAYLPYRGCDNIAGFLLAKCDYGYDLEAFTFEICEYKGGCPS
jgi:hypothetical protein